MKKELKWFWATYKRIPWFAKIILPVLVFQSTYSFFSAMLICSGKTSPAVMLVEALGSLALAVFLWVGTLVFCHICFG